jgi:hypothetical protein
VFDETVRCAWVSGVAGATYHLVIDDRRPMRQVCASSRSSCDVEAATARSPAGALAAHRWRATRWGRPGGRSQPTPVASWLRASGQVRGAERSELPIDGAPSTNFPSRAAVPIVNAHTPWSASA